MLSGGMGGSKEKKYQNNTPNEQLLNFAFLLRVQRTFPMGRNSQGRYLLAGQVEWCLFVPCITGQIPSLLAVKGVYSCAPALSEPNGHFRFPSRLRQHRLGSPACPVQILIGLKVGCPTGKAPLIEPEIPKQLPFCGQGCLSVTVVVLYTRAQCYPLVC